MPLAKDIFEMKKEDKETQNKNTNLKMDKSAHKYNTTLKKVNSLTDEDFLKLIAEKIATPPEPKKIKQKRTYSEEVKEKMKKVLEKNRSVAISKRQQRANEKKMNLNKIEEEKKTVVDEENNFKNEAKLLIQEQNNKINELVETLKKVKTTENKPTEAKPVETKPIETKPWWVGGLDYS